MLLQCIYIVNNDLEGKNMELKKADIKQNLIRRNEHYLFFFNKIY